MHKPIVDVIMHCIIIVTIYSQHQERNNEGCLLVNVDVVHTFRTAKLRSLRTS